MTTKTTRAAGVSVSYARDTNNPDVLLFTKFGAGAEAHSVLFSVALAAPELLAALRLSLIEMERNSATHGESEVIARAIIAARAAIAKAEGR